MGARSGEEAAEWPAKWEVEIVVPMRKRKGKKTDKNTYRGITLLSVGSKLLARVAAQRLNVWADGFLNEAQCGFRKGRGVDDALQVSRRIVEEVVRAKTDEWDLISFFQYRKGIPKRMYGCIMEAVREKRLPNRIQEYIDSVARRDGVQSQGAGRAVGTVEARTGFKGRVPVVPAAI